MESDLPRVQNLTAQEFAPFGTFSSLTPPDSVPLVDDAVIAFWPDCGGVLSLGPLCSNEVAIGICQVRWRELCITTAEIHTYGGEAILPLDEDIYLHLAPPSADDQFPNAEAFKVFFVPKGTCVILKAGVWHHAPYTTKEGSVVNTLILLPQRTYHNDCFALDSPQPIPFRDPQMG